MGRRQRLLIGMLCFMPLLVIMVYLSLALPRITNLLSRQELLPQQASPVYLFGHFMGLSVLLIVGVLINIGMIIFFLSHLINQPRASFTNKLFWVIAFALASPLSLPVYYFTRYRAGR